MSEKGLLPPLFVWVVLDARSHSIFLDEYKYALEQAKIALLDMLRMWCIIPKTLPRGSRKTLMGCLVLRNDRIDNALIPGRFLHESASSALRNVTIEPTLDSGSDPFDAEASSLESIIKIVADTQKKILGLESTIIYCSPHVPSSETFLRKVADLKSLNCSMKCILYGGEGLPPTYGLSEPLGADGTHDPAFEDQFFFKLFDFINKLNSQDPETNVNLMRVSRYVSESWTMNVRSVVSDEYRRHLPGGILLQFNNSDTPNLSLGLYPPALVPRYQAANGNAVDFEFQYASFKQVGLMKVKDLPEFSLLGDMFQLAAETPEGRTAAILLSTHLQSQNQALIFESHYNLYTNSMDIETFCYALLPAHSGFGLTVRKSPITTTKIAGDLIFLPIQQLNCGNLSLPGVPKVDIDSADSAASTASAAFTRNTPMLNWTEVQDYFMPRSIHRCETPLVAAAPKPSAPAPAPAPPAPEIIHVTPKKTPKPKKTPTSQKKGSSDAFPDENHPPSPGSIFSPALRQRLVQAAPRRSPYSKPS